VENYSKPPIGRYLSGISKSLLHALQNRLIHLDIDRNFYALMLIEEGQGKITQQELSDLLESDKVSVVRIIDYLSNKGYVERVKEPTDRRKHGLALTEKAKIELPEIKQAMEDVIQAAFSGLTAKNITELYNTLSVIKKNLI
jgi:MarR family transcriptional regulator for hemolysin